MTRQRNSRQLKGEGKKVYGIIVDGQTEKWYLQLLTQQENLKNIQIKPDLVTKAKLIDQYNLVIEAEKHYDKVIWIVDLDVILKEEAEKKEGGNSPLQEFNSYYKKLNAMQNVEVLINTPCLEYWYLLHIKDTSDFYTLYKEMLVELRNEPIEHYKKTEKYYKSGTNIYSRLKPNLSVAYERAKALGQYDPENPRTAKAEIYRLFEILNIEL
ncbi:RloB domain-containing protein [Ancylomarina euxinus]|uniref:RloB domain-containing protein n=1 Tax=Ancylomarina euxinus TaxID=2283627 RepID=A0A425Y295_9BACT|nr:RloB family protein [Ancylomarina euxinus]MCZ4695014.1 RloB family protein [Ancylomarina euxinus]MUP15050.1 RloB domain-containing protein [Ancylomarina euxinus]RRG21936.1 RloB domain-containing protein [Ancylomarina euxinus]